ncbi:glycosyltransferase family 2 protein [Pedobacter hiemivivus]|uniref:Glycosyltransferase family 2 protein n=1 Tax=Pedobacter hiemivivus TaxID=2530454 RepID=A0A4U1FYK6_9SPHI|nr:glycosyltransferase family 2 protein [Pedobacter hiemivivus]TKC55814.1 glycosyltransferase family 2 protein [Pedobacter hiemivivus]
MSHPLISIALCTYNGENYLIEQLDSLVFQDYPNLELIVVDDCSSDNTLEILRPYATKYPFIHIYQNENNLGYVKNFEKAISLCNGEYIALADQDDLWNLNKIRTLYQNIGNHILVYHDSAFVNERGESMGKKMSDIINLYKGHDFRPFLFRNCVSGHAMLFRRALIPHILPFNKSYFHDHWIAFVATNHGGIGLITKCLVNYRQHDNASTDILNSRIKKKEKEPFSEDKKLFKWLEYCKKNSNAKNYNFIDQLHQLMLQQSTSNRYNYKFTFFLIKNMSSLFFISKRNFWSKINLIRKNSRAKQTIGF